MASLGIVKKKIQSVETISKITHAMELVSTSKLKKLYKKYLMSNKYFIDFYNTTGELLSHLSQDKLFKNDSPKTLYILISSSLSLCGSYLNNINKKIFSLLNENDKVSIIGKKSYNFLLASDYVNCIYDFNEITENAVAINFEDMINKILNDYFDNKFGNISIVYTKYINSLNFEPTVLKVLPIDKEIYQNKKRKDDDNLELDCEPKEVIKMLIYKILNSLLYCSFLESKVCEHSARRVAMDSAKKNANELADKYKLTMNQMRQAKVTEEIIGIVSGANASKG